jgi:ABC-type iron transport system FetAB permease component
LFISQSSFSFRKTKDKEIPAAIIVIGNSMVSIAILEKHARVSFSKDKDDLLK